MKIAFIPAGKDPYDVHSWSGTDYYTRKSLENQGHEIYCIYGFEFKPSYTLFARKAVDKLRGYQFDVERTKENAIKWADFVAEHLQPDTDVILSLSTIKVAFLKTEIPIFIMVDSIFEMYRIFYGGSGSKKFNKEANEIEKNALENCAKLISCSKETGNFIRKFYHIPQGKIQIVPLGANLDIDPDENFVLDCLEKRMTDKVCKLLFVGVEWKRKGADIVVDVVRKLNSRNFPVELSLVGLKDVPVELPSNVKNYGFISKYTIDGVNKLEKLYSSSHFLFVPSIAEAYGLVFCEANAYAVPNISHREGGLTTIVEDGINGQLFDMGTKTEIFATYIEDTFNDKKLYKQLCLSSLDRYKKMLNWAVSGKKISDILRDTCGA